MTRATHERRNPPAVATTDVWTPGDLIEMDALTAACALAEADGGFDAEERDIILRLCERLDLAPARFEVVAEPGRGR